MFYLSIFFYLWGVSLNNGIIYQNNISDIVNIVTILLVIMIMGKIGINEYEGFITKIFYLLTLTMPLLASLSLLKYYFLLNGKYFDFLYFENRSYPWGTSLMPDYNMFALGMVIGLLAVGYTIKSTKSNLFHLYCLFGVLLISLSILFSGSRRGWIILIISLAYLLFCVLKKFEIEKLIKKNKLNYKYWLVFFTFIISIVWIYNNFSISINNQYEIEKLQYRLSTMDSLDGNFSERTDRWQYALDLIRNQFNIFNIFLGSGFSYLEYYSNYFKTGGYEDYPHNPFISTFLYSGLIGFVVVSSLYIVSFYKLFKLRKIFGLEMILIFLISFSFLVISGNSIFSSKLLLFNLILVSSITVSSITNVKNKIDNLS